MRSKTTARLIAFKGLSHYLGFDPAAPIRYTDKIAAVTTYERWFWKHRPDIIIQNNLVRMTRAGTRNYREIFAQFKKTTPASTG